MNSSINGTNQGTITNPITNDQKPMDNSVPQVTFNQSKETASMDKDNKYVTIGSTKEEVTNKVGNPDKVEDILKRWYYGQSYISFDQNNKVAGIYNSGNIKISMGEKVANSSPIKRGSTEEDVIRLMGTPDSTISILKRWQYGNSYVAFDDNFTVKEIQIARE